MKQKTAQKILNQTKQTYEQIAEQFSNTRKYAGKEFNLFKQYIKDNITIIDIGCGNGRVAKFLQENCKKKYNYIGIDNATNFIKIAKQLNPNNKFKEGDFFNIPTKNNSVDLLLYIRSFHHIPNKNLRIQALQEAKRVLKKEKIIFITVWNLWQKKYIKNIIKAIIKSILTLGKYKYNDLEIKWGKNHTRYYHAFTTKEIKKLLKQSNFKIISIKKEKDIIITAKND